MIDHFEEPPIAAIEPSKIKLCDSSANKTTSSLASSALPPDLVQTGNSSTRDDASSLTPSSLSSLEQDSIETADNMSCCSSDEEETAELIQTDAAAAATTKEAAASPHSESEDQASFLSLRITYLIVTLVVMLADGLQGTHLYVLYEGYGFTVANLYCLGFVTGGLASPITGALVDKFGRKKSAIVYCILEIIINRLEQYPMIWGLIFSRMVGGITTNLLSTVFDTWLDTEYRRRGIRKEGGYEIIMRDSVIVSNLAAIGSGYLAHVLAETYGPKGPFEGAVTCTSMALIVIFFLWTENYGCGEGQVKGMKEFMNDAVTAFQSDNKVLRLGIIQGLTCASIQIFIFLWSPALRHFAMSAPKGSYALDSNGEPAYGLIFGAFMAAGVLGGLAAPWVRGCATSLMKRFAPSATIKSQLGQDGEQTNDDRPMAVEGLSTVCYLASAFLLMLPCLLDGEGPQSFSICLVAFLIYEFIVGLYLPCEGVLRSIYFPAEGRCSILILPRIIVNCSVSVGVVMTNYMSMRDAFCSIVVLMVVAAVLQLSLILDVTWFSVSATPSVKITTLMNGVAGTKAEKAEAFQCPDLKRASFIGCLSETDDSSLSSEDASAEQQPGQKVKCQ